MCQLQKSKDYTAQPTTTVLLDEWLNQREMSMKDNVEANAAKWDETFNKGDTAGLAGFYAFEAVVVPAGGTAVAGPDAIGKFFADLQSKGFTSHKISVDAVMDRGDTLVATGKWQLNGPGEDGATKQYGGNWVNILGRDGAGWRILLHMWN